MAKYVLRPVLAVLLVLAAATGTVMTSLYLTGQPVFGLLAATGVSDDVVPRSLRRLVTSGPEPASSRSPTQERATPVRVGRIRRESVSTSLSFSGRLLARRQVEVRARVTGYVEEINFVEGALVEQNDVIYRIDPRTFEARVAQLEASLKGAQANLAFLEREVQRIADLEERQFAETSRLDERRSQRNQADARVNELKAELREARLDLEFASVEAPFAGKIGFSEVDEGDLVRAGQTELTTLVDFHPIEVEFQPNADQLARIKARQAEQGHPVRIYVSTDPGQPKVSGRITALGPVAQDTTNTVPVRGEVPNQDQKLVPGQFVRVTVDLGTQPKLLAPTVALVTRQNERAVYVASEAGTVEVVPVEIGRRVGERIVVRGQLRDGDRVITGNLQAVRPGMPVRVIEGQRDDEDGATPGRAAKGRTN